MKYKLIKTYPGSPKLNSEITNKKIECPNWYYLSNACLSIVENPENYPEFWELVVEKDYEILSYITVESEIIKYKDLDINDDCNCDKYLKIHSIKRLSDNQIFTIGDFVNNRTISSFSLNWIQTGFKIHCDNVGKGNINDGCFFELKDLKHIKQPLFTTEDGVDIFEGDEYYYINSNFNDPWKIINTKADCPDIINKNDLNYKRFSTKEKAEEYILLNKPCLSINDIIKNLTIIDGIKTLQDLVKSKIKQSV